MPSARGGPGHSGRCGFRRVLSTLLCSRMKGFYHRNYHYLCFGQASPKKSTLEPLGVQAAIQDRRVLCVFRMYGVRFRGSGSWLSNTSP